jgi:hypothetical protein
MPSIWCSNKHLQKSVLVTEAATSDFSLIYLSAGQSEGPCPLLRFRLKEQLLSGTCLEAIMMASYQPGSDTHWYTWREMRTESWQGTQWLPCSAICIGLLFCRCKMATPDPTRTSVFQPAEREEEMWGAAPLFKLLIYKLHISPQYTSPLLWCCTQVAGNYTS